MCVDENRKNGLIWELNPGPPTPEAGIIPLDQQATWWLEVLYCR